MEALLFGFLLNVVEAADELLVGVLEGVVGVDVIEAGCVDEREEEVAVLSSLFLYIVFFDELTNALPSMQGMAFNIILDHEVNGKWKLPKNARIAAAGNDLSDSLAANKMAEPLFNRFAHVYINTEVEDWLKWAKAPKKEYQRLDYTNFKPERKIHPAVISYIRYKSTSGQDVLRTPFTGDKPNADPRKWEMASKVLYKTNKPEMLRSLIGEQLTKDFVSYIIRSSRRKIKKL